MENCLTKARLGRNAARQLEQMAAHQLPITDVEMKRLCRRIQEGFDAVLGAAPPPPTVERNAFTVIRGDRP